MKQKLNKLDVMRTYARKEFSFVPRKSVFELSDLTSREILSLRSSHSIELVNYRVSKYGKTLFDSLDDDKRWALQTQYERAPVTEEEYHSVTTQLERYKDLFWLYLHRGAFDIAFEYEKLSGVNFESWCKLPRDVLNEKEELYKMWRFNESFHRAIEIAKWEYRGRVDKYGNDYMDHPCRVMIMGCTMNERIVGVLHHILEDSNWTLEKLREEGFADEVIEALRCLSSKSGDETYEEYIERVKTNQIATAVKLHDLEDCMDIRRYDVLTDEDIDTLKKYHWAFRKLYTPVWHADDGTVVHRSL